MRMRAYTIDRAIVSRDACGWIYHYRQTETAPCSSQDWQAQLERDIISNTTSLSTVRPLNLSLLSLTPARPSFSYCTATGVEIYMSSFSDLSSAGSLSALLQTVANASHNPIEPYVASGWTYMTDNYSRFTIAVWISLILHEVQTRLC